MGKSWEERKAMAWDIICTEDFNDPNTQRNMKNRLIDTMQEMNPILYWAGMEVINPYFVYHFTGTIGYPLEFVQKEFEERGIKWNENWSDWCEYWYKSFCTIPIKLIRDAS